MGLCSRIYPVLAVAIIIASCASNIYELPPPPEDAEGSETSLAPRVEEEASQNENSAARSAVLEAFNLLSTQRYDEAVELMSQETRAFLTHGTDASAAEVLARGELVLPSGRRVEFEPSTFFVASDVQTLEDDIDGVEQRETDRRREYFAVSADGTPHRVVTIKQGDRWVLHKTSVDGASEQ